MTNHRLITGVDLVVVPTDAFELEAAGAYFLGDTFDTGVCRQAIFADPDGNPLVLHHRYAPPKPKLDVD